MFREENREQQNKELNMGAFAVLPNEAISIITSRLRYPDLYGLSLASKGMHDIVEQSLTPYDIAAANQQGEKIKRKGSYAEIREVLNRRHKKEQKLMAIEQEPLYALYRTLLPDSWIFEMPEILCGILAVPAFTLPAHPTVAEETFAYIQAFALAGVGLSLFFNTKRFKEVAQLQQELQEMPNPLTQTP